MRCHEHCEDCVRKLGKPYEEVHRWLDELACNHNWSLDHRDHRHNLEGINEVRNRWGEEAARAAVLHILADWPNLKEEEIPKNEVEAILLRNKMYQIYNGGLHRRT